MTIYGSGMTVGLAILLALATPAAAGVPTLITACRALDTRLDPPAGELVPRPIEAGEERSIDVRGPCGLPEDATGISFNLTVVSPTMKGFMTLFAADEDRPPTSSINFAASVVLGNGGVAKLARSSDSGDVTLYLSRGQSHATLDVTSYYQDRMTPVVARIVGQETTIERWIEGGDGTATDRLTALQWEMKTNDGGTHDVDDTYSWSLGAPWEPDGTAFTVFLMVLNTAPCFAGHCDWRLPTVDELQSISEPGYPDCNVGPCTTIPGETAPEYYLSSSTFGSNPALAWFLHFADAQLVANLKTGSVRVRAVRGGS